ncbi:hypothetical protein ASE56_07760 [Microbacterium sp. Leaf203]|nr:hypothetical protein ASE56_07760 [Microbacterium sp. Leaf203]
MTGEDGAFNTSVTAPCSTTRPFSRTTAWVATCASTARSWVMKTSDMPASWTRERSRVRIPAWMVTSSAVVGSSAMSNRGRHARAIAIATRCRWPPESWCG